MRTFEQADHLRGSVRDPDQLQLIGLEAHHGDVSIFGQNLRREFERMTVTAGNLAPQ
jgi:hypothetical protein